MKPIPQEWIKKLVDQLLDAAKTFGPHSAMGSACLERADHYMDLVTAWRVSEEGK